MSYERLINTNVGLRRMVCTRLSTRRAATLFTRVKYMSNVYSTVSKPMTDRRFHDEMSARRADFTFCFSKHVYKRRPKYALSCRKRSTLKLSGRTFFFTTYFYRTRLSRHSERHLHISYDDVISSLLVMPREIYARRRARKSYCSMHGVGTTESFGRTLK